VSQSTLKQFLIYVRRYLETAKTGVERMVRDEAKFTVADWTILLNAAVSVSGGKRTLWQWALSLAGADLAKWEYHT